MDQVVINEIEPIIIERLKRRAANSGRSLEAELLSILRHAADYDWVSVSPELQRVRLLFADRTFSDSVDLLEGRQ